jgi:excisionase family DNA binding protein
MICHNRGEVLPMERQREIMTPEQAADYLQVNRETVYRYIRDGRLAASRLGRAYRIPRKSLDLPLWSTRTRDDITIREYTDAEIEQFLKEDELTGEAAQVAARFREVMDSSSTRSR